MIALSYFPPRAGGELKGALMQPGPDSYRDTRTEADVTDLVENLGYKPNTPVQKGIERFIEWYKTYCIITI